MITYTELFLFIGLALAGCYGFYWRNEAQKWHHMFKLMLVDDQARTEIIKSYKEFKERVG